RLERVAEREAELPDERSIAIEPLEDGVDHERLARALVRQQIRVGGRLEIEELPKQHAVRLPRRARAVKSPPTSPRMRSGCSAGTSKTAPASTSSCRFVAAGRPRRGT